MSGRLQRLVDRLFRLEEINGGHVCPTYLYRWTLLHLGSYRLYLHHFVGDDWSNDLHDHPKRFVSIGLKGAYVEETPGGFDGRWEVADDDDGSMVRVRWSQVDAKGRHFYCRHYSADAWGRNACESEARRLNDRGATPDAVAHVAWDLKPREEIFRAPWLRTFPADHVHRLRMIDGGDCWTLVLTGRNVRPWGFWPAGRFVPWRQYVNSPDAAAHRSCR